MPASDEHFSDWLGASPCRFARVFASRKRIRPVELLRPFAVEDVGDLEPALDAAGQAEEVVLIPWPLMRTALDLVAALRVLARAPRWKLEPVA